ncbi:MAG: hypothetical protein GWO02_17920 [Gammaproteobacteria bacterium]|nr:hypothetical protein [Gammaproteobacteria bacterium]
MKYLFLLNDSPYGTERNYNALRLAKSLLKREDTDELTVFLMADAVACAKAKQKPPTGYYDLEPMLQPVLGKGRVLACGSCMDARALTDGELMDGAARGTMDQLAEATAGADRVLIF